jgi:hypothetical protein
MAFLRLEDASYRGMNHVRLIGSTPGFRQDGTPTEQETSFEFAGPDNWDDPYNPWLGFDLSDNCSLDAGVGWIRRVNEQENLGLRLDTLDAQNTLALEMAARR